MNRPTPKPSFRSSLKSNGTLEIIIFEEIGENWWTGGGVTSQSVKEQIDNSTYSRISLRINSPGGDAFEGVAIHSVLRSQDKPIDVFVDGIAASSASIIAMAGDTITMGPGAMMMIHDAWSLCAGDASDMRKMADTLEKVSTSIAGVYVDRTGKDLADVQALMSAETWLSAQDCVAGGFATAISKHEDRAAMALAGSFKALAKLKHVPEKLKASVRNDDDDDVEDCECECPECIQGDCSACSHSPCDCQNCACENQANNSKVVDISNYSQYEARLRLLRAA